MKKMLLRSNQQSGERPASGGRAGNALWVFSQGFQEVVRAELGLKGEAEDKEQRRPGRVF